MEPDQVLERLSIVVHGDVQRVTARETFDLEFKREMTLPVFKKSLKTIAAFANRKGGIIVFGVQDRPKNVVGCVDFLDDGVQSEQISQYLSPQPTTKFFELPIGDQIVGVLCVEALIKQPCIAVKDLAGAEGKHLLNQGQIYVRRRGQTAPITGVEFNQIMNLRDESIRKEIFNFLSLGRSIGFENAVVGRPGATVGDEPNMTLYLPAEAASTLNVLDRAKTVESEGAPAYEIQGSIRLTVPNDDDPRNPMRAVDSATYIYPTIQEVFWADIPFNFSHLKKVTDNLGFWDLPEGDGVHTGVEQLTDTTKYYDSARLAVSNLVRQNPDEFIEICGSKKTKQMWAEMKNVADGIVG